jgi:D-lactate dehydrogenase
MKAVFGDLVFEDPAAIELEGVEFAIHPPLRSAEEISAAAGDADILLIRDQFCRITRDVLAGCPNLKLLITRSAGYDHIDLESAQAQGVVVCNVPDYGAHMIAEHAFGLMLAVARKICVGNRRYREERRFNSTGLSGLELYGKTLGVIGTGRIGRHSIRIGQGFGMNVIAYDVLQSEQLAAEMGFHYLSLQELLAAADFITIHVPLLPGTRHLISADTLDLVKPGAVLVNTSRGDIVDTDALRTALSEGRLRGAGLDVLEGEHDLYQDFGDLNVVVTPHIGWYTDEAVNRIMQVSLENVRAWLAGHPVNRIA